MTAETMFTNHLSSETSPYLLQHVNNPVEWYPWGQEALSKAQNENKPIFLSIGYAACHWCHVMEHESFEQEEVAAILNEHFVSIKVDREERPDLDEIYMTAVQMLTGSGGWPMTVFLTPELKPFYGGTYFPPEDRWGRPGFSNLITQIAEMWESDRQKITESADQITDAVQRQVSGVGSRSGAVEPSLLVGAFSDLEKSFDAVHGGFGEAPKFPSSAAISLLLRDYRRSGNEAALQMATKTLDEMSYGGIYDQLGGGFHRYSVDEQWLVPHFEKMLYDNAQLAQAYLEAWQLTGRDHYRTILRDILSYVSEQMTDEKGGFYSTEDADSEGEEGKFYIWTEQEILELLGDEDGRFVCEYYQVDGEGNFSSHEPYHTGQNILHLAQSPGAFAKAHEMTREELLAKLEPLEAKLMRARAERQRPGLDDKVLVSWNAMMISAFARAAQACAEETYLDTARKAADFIMNDMRRDGQLLHTYRHGTAKLPAYLDDYALLVQALIDLYEAGFEQRHLKAADSLTKEMLEHFWDDEDGGFFYTGEVHRNLIARTKSAYDGATPSGNSVAALALLRLAKLLGRDDYLRKAEAILELQAPQMERAPRGYLQMLLAVDFYLTPPKEIVIAGQPGTPEADALLRTVHERFQPNRVIAWVDPGAENELDSPLLAGKIPVDGKAAAYVCRDFACQQPVTDPAALAAQLEKTE